MLGRERAGLNLTYTNWIGESQYVFERCRCGLHVGTTDYRYWLMGKTERSAVDLRESSRVAWTVRDMMAHLERADSKLEQSVSARVKGVFYGGLESWPEDCEGDHVKASCLKRGLNECRRTISTWMSSCTSQEISTMR